MIRLDRTLEIDAPQSDVFAYIAEFENLPEWDPGTASVTKLSPGPTKVGTRYAVVVNVATGTSDMTYEVTEWEPSLRVALRGESRAMVAIDRISFASTADGATRVRYEAEFTMRRALRWSEGLLRRTFAAVGDKAMAGMAAATIPRRSLAGSERP